MPAEILFAILVVVTAAAHSVFTQRVRARQARVHTEILRRGTDAQGRVVAISRPMWAGGMAEVYFSFECPRGQQLRSCAIDLKALREQHTVSVPTVGAPVRVRYLPDNPSQALLPDINAR